MLLGELEAGFPWGVLLLTDEGSTEEIPTWASDEEQVTHSATAAVVRVMHQEEGDVTVRVLDDDAGARGGLAFKGVLDLPSGVLKVSDAMGEAMLRLQLERGLIGVVIYTDAAVEATRVDVVVTRGS